MSAFESTNRGTQRNAKLKHRGSNCHEALHRRAWENHVGLHYHWSFGPVRPVPHFDARAAIADYEAELREEQDSGPIIIYIEPSPCFKTFSTETFPPVVAEFEDDDDNNYKDFEYFYPAHHRQKKASFVGYFKNGCFLSR